MGVVEFGIVPCAKWPDKNLGRVKVKKRGVLNLG